MRVRKSDFLLMKGKCREARAGVGGEKALLSLPLAAGGHGRGSSYSCWGQKFDLTLPPSPFRPPAFHTRPARSCALAWADCRAKPSSEAADGRFFLCVKEEETRLSPMWPCAEGTVRWSTPLSRAVALARAEPLVSLSDSGAVGETYIRT